MGNQYKVVLTKGNNEPDPPTPPGASFPKPIGTQTTAYAPAKTLPKYVHKHTVLRRPAKNTRRVKAVVLKQRKTAKVYKVSKRTSPKHHSG